MYMTDHILPVIPITHLVNQDGEPTTPKKLATGTKPSVSNMRVLFYPCFAQKATADIDTKTLSMCPQSRKGFWDIFFVIPKYQKGYLI